MPAQSKAQQRFMGMVHAVQKGDMEAPSKEVEKAADSMSDKAAKDFASTKHKGLPNKKENMNTSITKSKLKELVKEVMTEENEYQAFFQKALDKAGKSIPSMSEEEKKAFFNKIDTAWNGKGEKNEGNAFGAAASKAKQEGDDEFKVDGEEYKVESISTELPNATIPTAIKMKLSQAIDKIKDVKLNPMQKLQLVAQVVDSLGVDKSQLGTIANKIRSKMESVTEAKDDEEASLNEKEYPSFADPLEGFPTEYKELLKKLQRSNNSDERTKLINKMNVIRKNIKLKPLTNELLKN